MYLSRLTFFTLPGKTQEVEERLMMLRQWVEQAGGANPRVMRTHFGSSGAPDLVFEQEVTDPGTLESQIKEVSDKDDFQRWAREVSGLLAQPSKRELYTVCDGAPSA
jgi:hypothetical protein